MESKGRGRGRGRGNFKSSLDQREEDIQREPKALDQHSFILRDDIDAAKAEFEILKSKFEDDIFASVFSATVTTQQEVTQDEPEVLQTTAVENNPENIGEQNEGASGIEVTVEDYVPSNLIEAAGEFRVHSNPGLGRISQHFFCIICGCPAGRNSFLCRKRGHLVCKQCKVELNNHQNCLYVLRARKTGHTNCDSVLVPLKSPLGKGIFEITTVNCQYRQNGCRTEGTWNVIKKHQATCPFVKKA